CLIAPLKLQTSKLIGWRRDRESQRGRPRRAGGDGPEAQPSQTGEESGPPSADAEPGQQQYASYGRDDDGEGGGRYPPDPAAPCTWDDVTTRDYLIDLKEFLKQGMSDQTIAAKLEISVEDVEMLKERLFDGLWDDGDD